MDYIYCEEIPPSETHDTVMDGGSTEGMNAMIRAYGVMQRFGASNNLVGGTMPHFHVQTKQALIACNRVAPTFGPRGTIANRPDGWNNDARDCADHEHLWGKQLAECHDGLHKVHAKRGGTVGFALNTLSDGGGSLPVTQASNWELHRRYPGAVVLSTLRLKYDLNHVKNFEAFPEYPDVRNPVLVARNDPGDDQVYAILPGIIATSSHITSSRTHRPSELFNRVSLQGTYSMLGVAAAFRDEPQVQINITKLMWRYVVGTQHVPNVSPQSTVEGLSEAIVGCLQKEHELYDYPKLRKDTPQAIAVGGLPGHFHDAKMRELSNEIHDKTMAAVHAKLAKRKQELPEGIEIIWAPILEVPRQGFVRFWAIRVFGVPGGHPRDEINKLIAKSKK